MDVSSLRNGQGAALGNGGKVFVDADYLYQSGQIFANGQQGGLVQVNVAGVRLAPGALIQARGEGGNGGVAAINSSGPVDIDLLTEIDTSGRVSANFDTNVISVEGSLVNLGGISVPMA